MEALLDVDEAERTRAKAPPSHFCPCRFFVAIKYLWGVLYASGKASLDFRGFVEYL